MNFEASLLSLFPKLTNLKPGHKKLRLATGTMASLKLNNGSINDHTESEVSERTKLIPTKTSSNEADENMKTLSNPTETTTAALAVAMLVQSYLLVSVFPYSGFLAMFLIPGLNEETDGILRTGPGL